MCSRGAPDPPESALGALAIYDMIYNMPRIYNLILYRILEPTTAVSVGFTNFVWGSKKDPG